MTKRFDILEYWKELDGNPAFDKVMKDILQECGIDESSYVPNAPEGFTEFREGQRSIAIFIKDRIKKSE